MTAVQVRVGTVHSAMANARVPTLATNSLQVEKDVVDEPEKVSALDKGVHKNRRSLGSRKVKIQRSKPLPERKLGSLMHHHRIQNEYMVSEEELYFSLEAVGT